MTKLRRRAFEIRHALEAQPLPVVSDALMASRGVADGRLIPVLILDTSSRPDIDSMVRAHESLGPGDVMSGWGVRSRFDSSHIRLFLSVSRPSSCTLLIDLPTVTRGGTVDRIVQAQGLYVQPGRPGDRLASTLDHPRILVEVPSRDFRSTWEVLLRKELTRSFRRQGLSRSNAKKATTAFLNQWRDFTATRMPSEFDV